MANDLRIKGYRHRIGYQGIFGAIRARVREAIEAGLMIGLTFSARYARVREAGL